MKSSPDWKELFPAPSSGTMAAVFNMHELIACWSGSNWQSYISFIENRLQGITRPALSVTTDDIGRTEPAIQPATMNEATLTEPAASSSQVRDGLEEMDEKWGGTLRQQSSFKQVVLRANSFIPNRKNVTKSTAVTPRTVWGHRFSFDDLPRLHFLEEKANEALDVLSNNVDILNALRDDYCSLEQQLIIDHGVPVWRTEMDRFARAIAGVQKTCKTQQARVRQLLRLIADRKALVSDRDLSAFSVANYRSAPKDSGLRFHAGKQILSGASRRVSEEYGGSCNKDEERGRLYANYNTSDAVLLAWDFYLGKYRQIHCRAIFAEQPTDIDEHSNRKICSG